LRLMYGSILVTAPHKLRNEQSFERHVNEQVPNQQRCDVTSHAA
jgi:hypothetical protein